MTCSDICVQLMALQRQRAACIKTRVQVGNRLQAVVASSIGYYAGMDESERAKKWTEASALIKRIAAGEEPSHPLAGLVMLCAEGELSILRNMQKHFEKPMQKLARRLPVAAWLEHPDRRGISLDYLAVIVGETGDLANYANPAKVWKRLGCAPFTKDGATRMGGHWRRAGGLHAEDWTAFGYSPRRRSIAYMIGEGIVKQNKGPYRARYDEAKEKRLAQNREGDKPIHAHLHGMLLATKMFLRDLWVEWQC